MWPFKKCNLAKKEKIIKVQEEFKVTKSRVHLVMKNGKEYRWEEHGEVGSFQGTPVYYHPNRYLLESRTICFYDKEKKGTVTVLTRDVDMMFQSDAEETGEIVIKEYDKVVEDNE